MVGHAVATGVAHANNMIGDAHGNVARVARDLDIAAIVQCRLQFASFDPLGFVLTKQGCIISRVSDNSACRPG